VTERPVRLQPYHAVVALLCAAVFISYIDRTNISVGAIAMRLQFGWNETQKGVVLSSFYVGYISLMLASGALANRFGGRIVLGAAVVWWSLFTLLTPVAASISLPLLVTARIASQRTIWVVDQESTPPTRTSTGGRLSSSISNSDDSHPRKLLAILGSIVCRS